MNRHSTKGGIQVANKYIKRCSVSLATREMQVDTTKRYYRKPIRMTEMENSDNTRCVRKDAEKLDHLYIADRNVDGTAPLKHLVVS